MNKVVVLAGVGIGLLGLWWIAQKASASEGGGSGSCRDLEAEQGNYAIYRGSRKSLKDALGACVGDGWSGVLAFEVWSDSVGNYVAVTDPDNYYLAPGAKCYIEVLAACRLCSFEWL